MTYTEYYCFNCDTPSDSGRECCCRYCGAEVTKLSDDPRMVRVKADQVDLGVMNE